MRKIVILVIIVFLTGHNSLFSQGTLEELSFYSNSLEADRSFNIYLPEGYNSNQEDYPVIYFLHGLGCDHNTYTGSTTIFDYMISIGSIEPVIVVFPDGSVEPYGGSFYTNSLLYGNFEDYIVYDLVDYIDENFRTKQDKNKRCIIGHSMGGYGAMKLAIKHVELFAAVSALSGPLDLNSFEDRIPFIELENGNSPPYDYTPDETKFFTYAMFTFAGAFSPNMDNPPYYVDLPLDENAEVIDSVFAKFILHNPANLASEYELTDLAIFFDCGEQDELGMFNWNNSFADSLSSFGINYQYQTYTGTHTSGLTQRIPISMSFCDSVMKSVTDVETTNKFVENISCYPNPFSGSSVISYQVPEKGNIKIDIYNSLGQKIITLVNEFQDTGEQSAVFDGTNLPVGIYYYTIQIGESFENGKLLLVR
ncbi:alpha/beta hydrolase-fold protein [Bacteroidota bacterium]